MPARRRYNWWENLNEEDFFSFEANQFALDVGTQYAPEFRIQDAEEFGDLAFPIAESFELGYQESDAQAFGAEAQQMLAAEQERQAILDGEENRFNVNQGVINPDIDGPPRGAPTVVKRDDVALLGDLMATSGANASVLTPELRTLREGYEREFGPGWVDEVGGRLNQLVPNPVADVPVLGGLTNALSFGIERIEQGTGAASKFFATPPNTGPFADVPVLGGAIDVLNPFSFDLIKADTADMRLRAEDPGATPIQGTRRWHQWIREVEGSIPKEALDHLDETIGFSFFANPSARAEAILGVQDTMTKMERNADEFLALHPNLDDLSDEAFGELRDTFVAGQAAVWSEDIQALTDKHGIAWAEIVGNIVLDPLNFVGFGLMGKIPLAGKVLGPAERMLTLAVDKPWNFMGAQFKRAIGTTATAQINAYRGKVVGELTAYFVEKGVIVHEVDDGVRALFAESASVGGLGPRYSELDAFIRRDPFGNLEHSVKGMSPAEAGEVFAAQSTVHARADFTVGAKRGGAGKWDTAPTDSIEAISRQMGLIGDLFNKVMPRNQRLASASSTLFKPVGNALDALHRNVNLPLARYNLWFASYGPFNALETGLLSIANGVSPLRSGRRDYAAIQNALPALPHLAGKEAPDFLSSLVGGRRLSGKGKDIPLVGTVAEFFNKYAVELGDNVDSAVRQNFTTEKLFQYTTADGLIGPTMEEVARRVRQDLPKELRPLADQIAFQAGIYANIGPDALRGLADRYGADTINEKILGSLIIKYQKLPPDVLQHVLDFARGKITDVDELNRRMLASLDEVVRVQAFGNPDVLAAMVEHIDGVARGLSPAPFTPEGPPIGPPLNAEAIEQLDPLLRDALELSDEGFVRAGGGSELFDAVLRRRSDEVSDLLDNIDVSDAAVRSADEQIRRITQESLVHRGLPEEFTVYRGGAIRGEFVPVSLDRSTARFFAGQPSGEDVLQAYRVRRADVAADVQAFTGGMGFQEAELLVPPDALRPVEPPAPGPAPDAGLEDLQRSYMGAAILHDQTYRRLEALTQLERDALREGHQMGLIEALDFELQDALDQLDESYKRLVAIGKANPALEKHKTLGAELSDLFRTHRGQIRAEVEPLYQLARDAAGGAPKKQAWERAIGRRQKIWAEHDRLADALIETQFPTLAQVRQEVVDVVQAGATAAEGSVARQASDTYQLYDDVYRGENSERITDLMGDIHANVSSKATEQTQAALVEILDDIARTVEIPEGSREALDAVSQKVRSEYDSTFLQYPGNSLDAAMRFVDPYWLYQSRRLGRITKEAIKHPGMVRLYEDYFASSDQGYINFNGFRHQVDLTRGTLLANLASGRRRGAILDIEALANGDLQSVVRGDRFGERYDGWAGKVEQMQEIVGAVGIHPGAMVELALGGARAIGAAFSGDPDEDVLESLELGSNLVVPLAESLINMVELTGADTTGLRRILHDPFYQRQLELEFTDQLQRAQEAGLDPESGRDPVAARRAVALDRLMQSQTGMTRVRSEEKLSRDQARDEVLAEQRGITVSEARELRRRPDFIMSPLESELYEERVGERVRDQERRASRLLQGPKLRAIGTAIDEKNIQLRKLKYGDPEAEEGSPAQRGWKAAFDLKIERLNSSPETLRDMASNFWEEFYDVQNQFAPQIPSSRAEWDVLRQSYGMTVSEPAELALAMDELRAVRPELFKDELNFVEWDKFFAAQDAIKDRLSPEAQKEFEALTGLADAKSVLPHPEAFRLGSELWREYNDQPRYIYLDEGGGMQTFTGQDADHIGYVDAWIGNQLGSQFTRAEVNRFDNLTQTKVALTRFRVRAARGEFDHEFGDVNTAIRATLLWERDAEAKLAVARGGGETPRQRFWRVINEGIPFPGGEGGLLEVLYSGAESTHE